MEMDPRRSPQPPLSTTSSPPGLVIALSTALGVTTAVGRALAVILTGVTVAVVFAPNCLAQTSVASTAGSADVGELSIDAGLQQAALLRGSSGQADMVLQLTAAAASETSSRPSMGVALVIDRSGSMCGDKIVNARAAAVTFLRNLADGDVVSIFQYDDVVEQLAPPTVISAATREALAASVTQMYPRGSTNLHGGLQAGIASLRQAASERPIRRVILISDGMANVGPSSPGQLGAVAAGASAQGISVTAIGVGLQYDEAVLGALAVRSGGRFYHLQEPAQMAAILESELQALNRTVARNVVLDLAPAPGVSFIGATGADVRRQGGRVQLHVGEVLGDTTRPVVVTLRLPTSGPAERPAAEVALRYVSAASGQPRSDHEQVTYRLTRSQSQARRSINPTFAMAVEQHHEAEANQRAAEMLQRGQEAQAAELLAQQARRMEQTARRMPARQRRELTQRAQRMRRSSRETRRTRSPRARRARSLQMSDDALDGFGF